MLVLTRKSNQSIMIGDDIEVSVFAIVGEKVRIGIQAPRDVPVFRKEVYLEIQDEHRADAAKPEDVVAEVDAALQGLGEARPDARQVERGLLAGRPEPIRRARSAAGRAWRTSPTVTSTAVTISDSAST